MYRFQHHSLKRVSILHHRFLALWENSMVRVHLYGSRLATLLHCATCLLWWHCLLLLVLWFCEKPGIHFVIAQTVLYLLDLCISFDGILCFHLNFKCSLLFLCTVSWEVWTLWRFNGSHKPVTLEFSWYYLPFYTHERSFQLVFWSLTEFQILL